MKYTKIISGLCFYLAIALTAISHTGCTPDEIDGGLAPAPRSEMVQFTATPSEDNDNIIIFTNTTPGAFRAIWDFGNGSAAEGAQVSSAYPTKGSYTVKLTIITNGGYASNTQTINIAETDVSMLDREDYNTLTGGGASNAAGKTWVIDRHQAGHLGVGPVEETSPIWWSAPANDKASEGLYDDEMTFNLNGFAYTYQNNGDTFVNGANAAGLGGTAQADDYTLSHTPPTDMTWSIVDEGSKKFLVLTNGGFLGYYTGVSRYEILTLTENELYLKAGDGVNPALSWWLRLVPEGYTVPVTPRTNKMENMFDSFDGNGNMVWKKDQLTFNESYDNPAPLAPNTSPKVAMYIKQEGEPYAFANLFADYTYNFDLSSRNVFKLKVFMPSYNDYTSTAGYDWAIKNMLKQVSMKLQDGTSGAPWETQVEIKKEVTQLDKWVELTFDFSEFADRKDLNRIVIQIGGEGHYIPGIFFIDDFRLE
ncbi:PKD domain-containing protein [uncultured Pontibacter sp.]|uniref:PKD domain-containing protein n=1 Tax=uncultured Pontibacter sp. TaxID=453356 RepID=UPI00260DBDDE|nr:PKD domain-containing protein [uncultured Pontibacter sp.]